MKNKETICANLAQALMEYLEVMCTPRDEPSSGIRLYSFEELVEMLGKSKSTVRQWVCAGKFGEPVKVGNSTRVTQAGLDKFIADHSGPTKKQQPQGRSHSARTPAPHHDLSSMRL